MAGGNFTEILKKNGSSVTRERERLFELLKSHGKPYNVSSLVIDTSSYMNKTTVYRNLDLFEKLGITHRVYTGWKYKVELSDIFRKHHHHMTCTNCGAVVSFEEPASLLNELKKIETNYGFEAKSHTLELSGLCKSCC